MITINEERFTTTRRHISAMTQDLTIHRIRGVVGSDMTPKQRVHACASPITRPLLTPSLLGCGSSHLRALRCFLDNFVDDDYIIIMEDDARMDRAFHDWDGLVDEMRWKGLDMLHLGGFSTPVFHQSIITRKTEAPGRIVPIGFWISNAGYIISRRGARAIVNHLDNGGIMYHIDIMYHILIHKGLLRAGAVRDAIVFQHEDTHTTSTNASIGDSWSDMACRLVSPDLQFVASMAVMRVPFAGISIKPSMIVDMVVAILIPPKTAVFLIALLLMGRDRRWAMFLVFVLATVAIYGNRARRAWAVVIGAITAVMTMILVLAFRNVHNNQSLRTLSA